LKVFDLFLSGVIFPHDAGSGCELWLALSREETAILWPPLVAVLTEFCVL
jgi:hypothetical protein